MKKTRLNFIIDAIAFAGFVSLTTTGVLMRYILPPGSGRSTTIWGLDRHEWGDIHFWVSAVFLLILALHLVLHWRWIANVIRGRPREGSGYRATLGMVGFIAVIALASAPLLAPVEKSGLAKESHDLPGASQHDETVRGSMTLQEIEDVTGVPASHLIKALGLPASTSADERLGPLKREYGFVIDDARRIIRAYGEDGEN